MVRGPRPPRPRVTPVEKRKIIEDKNRKESDKIKALELEAANRLDDIKNFVRDIDKQDEEDKAAKTAKQLDDYGVPISSGSDEPSDYESPGTPPKVPTPEGLSEEEIYQVYRKRRRDQAIRLHRRAKRAAKRRQKNVTMNYLQWQIGFTDTFTEVATARINSPIMRLYRLTKIRKAEGFLGADLEVLRNPGISDKRIHVNTTWGELRECVLDGTKKPEGEKKKEVLEPTGLKTMDDFLKSQMGESTDSDDAATRKERRKEEEKAKEEALLQEADENRKEAEADKAQKTAKLAGLVTGSSVTGLMGQHAAMKIRKFSSGPAAGTRGARLLGKVGEPQPKIVTKAMLRGEQAVLDAGRSIGDTKGDKSLADEQQECSLDFEEQKIREERDLLKAAVFGSSLLEKKSRKRSKKGKASSKRQKGGSAEEQEGGSSRNGQPGEQDTGTLDQLSRAGDDADESDAMSEDHDDADEWSRPRERRGSKTNVAPAAKAKDEHLVLEDESVVLVEDARQQDVDLRAQVEEDTASLAAEDGVDITLTLGAGVEMEGSVPSLEAGEGVSSGSPIGRVDTALLSLEKQREQLQSELQEAGEIGQQIQASICTANLAEDGPLAADTTAGAAEQDVEGEEATEKVAPASMSWMKKDEASEAGEGDAAEETETPVREEEVPLPTAPPQRPSRPVSAMSTTSSQRIKAALQVASEADASSSLAGAKPGSSSDAAALEQPRASPFSFAPRKKNKWDASDAFAKAEAEKQAREAEAAKKAEEEKTRKQREEEELKRAHAAEVEKRHQEALAKDKLRQEAEQFWNEKLEEERLAQEAEAEVQRKKNVEEKARQRAENAMRVREWERMEREDLFSRIVEDALKAKQELEEKVRMRQEQEELEAKERRTAREKENERKKAERLQEKLRQAEERRLLNEEKQKAAAEWREHMLKVEGKNVIPGSGSRPTSRQHLQRALAVAKAKSGLSGNSRMSTPKQEPSVEAAGTALREGQVEDSLDLAAADTARQTQVDFDASIATDMDMMSTSDAPASREQYSALQTELRAAQAEVLTLSPTGEGLADIEASTGEKPRSRSRPHSAGSMRPPPYLPSCRKDGLRPGSPMVEARISQKKRARPKSSPGTVKRSDKPPHVEKNDPLTFQQFQVRERKAEQRRREEEEREAQLVGERKAAAALQYGDKGMPPTPPNERSSQDQETLGVQERPTSAGSRDPLSASFTVVPPLADASLAVGLDDIRAAAAERGNQGPDTEEPVVASQQYQILKDGRKVFGPPMAGSVVLSRPQSKVKKLGQRGALAVSAVAAKFFKKHLYTSKQGFGAFAGAEESASATDRETMSIASTPLPSARGGRHRMDKVESSAAGSSAVCSMSEAEGAGTSVFGRPSAEPFASVLAAGSATDIGASATDVDDAVVAGADEERRGGDAGTGAGKKARVPNFSAIPEEQEAEAQEAEIKAKLQREKLLKDRQRAYEEAEESGDLDKILKAKARLDEVTGCGSDAEDANVDLDEEEDSDEDDQESSEGESFVDFCEWTPVSSVFDTDEEEELREDMAELDVIVQRELKRAREAEERAERMGRPIERMETPRSPQIEDIEVLEFELDHGTAKPGVDLKLKIAQLKLIRHERKQAAMLRRSVATPYSRKKYRLGGDEGVESSEDDVTEETVSAGTKSTGTRLKKLMASALPTRRAIFKKMDTIVPEEAEKKVEGEEDQDEGDQDGIEEGVLEGEDAAFDKALLAAAARTQEEEAEAARLKTSAGDEKAQIRGWMKVQKVIKFAHTLRKKVDRLRKTEDDVQLPAHEGKYAELFEPPPPPPPESSDSDVGPTVEELREQRRAARAAATAAAKENSVVLGAGAAEQAGGAEGAAAEGEKREEGQAGSPAPAPEGEAVAPKAEVDTKPADDSILKDVAAPDTAAASPSTGDVLSKAEDEPQGTEGEALAVKSSAGSGSGVPGISATGSPIPSGSNDDEDQKSDLAPSEHMRQQIRRTSAELEELHEKPQKTAREKLRLRQILACNKHEQLRYVMTKPESIPHVATIFECTFDVDMERTLMHELDRSVQRMALERERLEELHLKWICVKVKTAMSLVEAQAALTAAQDAAGEGKNKSKMRSRAQSGAFGGPGGAPSLGQFGSVAAGTLSAPADPVKKSKDPLAKYYNMTPEAVAGTILQLSYPKDLRIPALKERVETLQRIAKDVETLLEVLDRKHAEFYPAEALRRYFLDAVRHISGLRPDAEWIVEIRHRSFLEDELEPDYLNPDRFIVEIIDPFRDTPPKWHFLVKTDMQRTNMYVTEKQVEEAFRLHHLTEDEWKIEKQKRKEQEEEEALLKKEEEERERAKQAKRLEQENAEISNALAASATSQNPGGAPDANNFFAGLNEPEEPQEEEEPEPLRRPYHLTDPQKIVPVYRLDPYPVSRVLSSYGVKRFHASEARRKAKEVRAKRRQDRKIENDFQNSLRREHGQPELPPPPDTPSDGESEAEALAAETDPARKALRAFLANPDQARIEFPGDVLAASEGGATQSEVGASRPQSSASRQKTPPGVQVPVQIPGTGKEVMMTV
ncbi:unnamed protein product [Amoebophrya sp. A25]|nr:unnamed protein product [Amoebophrya sp. A25]|eukprot:GSA25T00019351001.1